MHLKKFARRNCDYLFAGLKKIVPEALNSGSVVSIRRVARKYYRYMDAYREGDEQHHLSIKQVEYAVKKYKRHRSIPVSILEDL